MKNIFYIHSFEPWFRKFRIHLRFRLITYPCDVVWDVPMVHNFGGVRSISVPISSGVTFFAIGIAYQYMKASLIRHVKGVDELGNIIEVKMWEMIAPAADKPYGYKYSLVYVVNGVRVIGYDNAEGRGDHRH
jgi:hypothetical protein